MTKLRLVPNVPEDKTLDPIDLRDEFGVTRQDFFDAVCEALLRFIEAAMQVRDRQTGRRHDAVRRPGLRGMRGLRG